MTTAAVAPDGGADRHSVTRELLELVRATCGGLLFGIPLLYTMEMWFSGPRSQPATVVAVLGGIFVILFVLNSTEGFRTRRDTSWVDAAIDATIGLAVGLVTTLLVLVLLRQVTFEVPIASALGMVVYESIPFCLGVGLARHLLHGNRDGDDDEDAPANDDPAINPTVADLGAAAIGAAFIAVTIAPTDEVVVLSAKLSPAWLLALVGATLLISYAIVFVAGFWGQERRHGAGGILQSPLAETIAAYLVSLAIAWLLLVIFHRAEVPSSEVLGRVLVLGLPAAVGGAAGRLAV
ncbi:TIGR02587 family membrane protein [Kribbia dieselivorans]|uniref:TIGR02587 family membrane protein n=1 Tax=Kribbia dieselivorans TaxID=331526 RepID=UPI000837B8B7|nr:TIGR02587 family membrane protein [Kribbia dieselivorans]